MIRRPINKGLLVSNATVYMLAALIANPIVPRSTYAAFREQTPAVHYARVGVGYLVSVIVASAGIICPCARCCAGELSEGSGRTACFHRRLLDSRWQRVARAVTVSLDVTVSFRPGCGGFGAVQHRRESRVDHAAALDDWIATPSMTVLEAILSLCSTSDAFIAATFTAFPRVAS